VDCKFLNFGVNIEKVLKLHRLKMYFPLDISDIARASVVVKMNFPIQVVDSLLAGSVLCDIGNPKA
jgi:hypothetical protein